jgi:hypothetical protein
MPPPPEPAPPPPEPLDSPPLPPGFENSPPAAKAPWQLSILHHEIVALVKQLELTPQEVQERKVAAGIIRDVAQEIWPYADVSRETFSSGAQLFLTFKGREWYVRRE